MQTRSSLRAVNLLFLLALMLQLTNLLFMAVLPQYVRLILNEALFVFLPAYLYLRLTKQPIAARVGWRWPGWKIAALAFVIGAGLYPVSIVIAGMVQQVLGYTSFAAAADIIPTGTLMGVLAIVAFAVMAPLCEEFFFRGVMQPVYAQKGPRWAVLFVGLLFILFHLALVQGISIILLALALGYVYHRTRSLPASILTHVGANGLAALVVTSQVFPTGIENVVGTGPAIVGGLVAAALAVIGLRALTRPTVETAPPAVTAQAGEPESPPARPGRWAVYWPLAVALLLWLPVVTAEFIYSYGTGLIPAPPLAVEPVEWNAPQVWNYEIRNVADEVVGTGQCGLTVEADLHTLTCTSTTQAYEAQRGSSYYMSSGGTRIDRLTWQADNCAQVEGAVLQDLVSGFHSETNWTPAADGIQVRIQQSGEETSEVFLPYDETPLSDEPALPVVHDYSWPWQIAGLSKTQGVMGDVMRFHPNTWRDETQDSGPAAKREMVRVVGKEKVTTPAGTFDAWKVTLGLDLTAWYPVDGGRAPVQFFNGVETWSLSEQVNTD